MAWRVIADLRHPGSSWDQDVATAREDLDATTAQAVVVAANAMAWRLTIVCAPVAALVILALFLSGHAPLVAVPVAAAIGLAGPLDAAMFLTYPIELWAGGETRFKGSREARIRFGVTNFVYPYYGWRYAVRGRTRPWGALSTEEKVAANPSRAAFSDSAPPRESYWPQ